MHLWLSKGSTADLSLNHGGSVIVIPVAWPGPGSWRAAFDKVCARPGRIRTRAVHVGRRSAGKRGFEPGRYFRVNRVHLRVRHVINIDSNLGETKQMNHILKVFFLLSLFSVENFTDVKKSGTKKSRSELNCNEIDQKKEKHLRGNSSRIEKNVLFTSFLFQTIFFFFFFRLIYQKEVFSRIKSRGNWSPANGDGSRKRCRCCARP